MAKVKMIAALLLVAVGLVVVLQNTQPVETRFLFMTVTMPRAVLLIITMLIGIAVGILVALGLSGRKTK
ncbi:MAG: LapA family protein [Desulfobacterium sp.]|nr:LapA family protein [Desulfobacterium sp.]